MVSKKWKRHNTSLKIGLIDGFYITANDFEKEKKPVQINHKVKETTNKHTKWNISAFVL